MCSKQSWDDQIRKWRRLLHDYDPPIEDEVEEAEYLIVANENKKVRIEKIMHRIQM
jgi:hypothetical protein